MPQFERRLYEPTDDMRAFDAGEDDLEEEGSRLPLLIVIALVVLASFGGVVWLAYSQGVQRGRESAPRVIAAQPKKTASAEKNPYAGLKIYQPSKPEDEAIDKDTAPPPPTLVTPKSLAPAPAATPAGKPVASAIKPAVPSTKSVPAPVPNGTKPLAVKPSAVARNNVAPAVKASVSRPGPALVPSPTAPRVATAAPRIVAPPSTLKPPSKPAVPTTKSAGLTPPPAKTKAKPVPTVMPTAKPSPAKTATFKPAGQTAALNPAAAEKPPPAAEQTAQEHGVGFVLQIGSYKSEADASASWQAYKSAHPTVAGYASDIHRAELGAKGTWYRLRVGPFTSLTEANAACAKLKASGGNCFPAKR